MIVNSPVDIHQAIMTALTEQFASDIVSEQLLHLIHHQAKTMADNVLLAFGGFDVDHEQQVIQFVTEDIDMDVLKLIGLTLPKGIAYTLLNMNADILSTITHEGIVHDDGRVSFQLGMEVPQPTTEAG